MAEQCQRKVELSYPCQWSYKVIGRDKRLVADAIEEIFGVREYTLTYSNMSRTGKYYSWAVDLVVASEVERNSLFAELKKHNAVKIVI